MSKLVDIVKNNFRRSLLVGFVSLPLFFSSCKKPVESDPVNSVPVAYVDVSPLSGVVPLSSRVKVWGSDADGLDDIVSYTLNIDGHDSTCKSPFDFVKTFNTSAIHKIYGVVSDSHGATNKSKIVSVVVSDKPPIVYNAPVASLSVSSTSGYSPLTVRFKVNGTDKDNDISSYRLYLDGVVDSSSVPIDTTMTLLHGTHLVYAEVVDMHKLSSKTSTTSINVTSVSSWSNPFPFPKGKVNLFMPDSTMVEYNSLKTKSERDGYIEAARANDITPTIPNGTRQINGVDYSFVCNQASQLFSIDCITILDNTYFGSTKLYNWYKDDAFDSIYRYRGTLKYAGIHKAPVFTVEVSATHQMNYAITGNDLQDGKSLNLIETMKDYSRSNVQMDGRIFPINYDEFMLYYKFTYIDKDGKNSLANIPIAKYNLVNGVLNFVSANPNVDVILARDDVAPIINVRSPVDGKTYAANNKILLDEIVTAETYRYGYYSFDGGATKIPIRQKEKMDLIYQGNRYFKPGSYTLNLYAKNEFFIDANKTINFTVK